MPILEKMAPSLDAGIAGRQNHPCPKPRPDFTLITRKPRLESGPLVPTARVP